MRRATYAASAWSTGLDYGASYGCTSDDPALIVTRATEAAKFGEGASGWSGYSLLTNNCETFAYWCSTGRRVMSSTAKDRDPSTLRAGEAIIPCMLPHVFASCRPYAHETDSFDACFYCPCWPHEILCYTASIPQPFRKA